MYTFSAPRTFTLAELRGLGSVEHAQLREVTESWLGVDLKPSDDFTAKIRAKAEVDDSFTLSRFDIARDGEPAYQMWVWLDENGIVFHRNSADPSPIRCVNRNFWSVDDSDEDAIAMAAELNDLDPLTSKT